MPIRSCSTRRARAHACPKVVDVVTFGGRSEVEMLRLAACLEEHYPHSMANAVVQAARDRGLLHEEMHSGWSTLSRTALQAP